MTMLASCDKIEADLPSSIGNDKILNISDDIDANTIQDIYDALDKEQHEITVDEEIAKKAVACIDRMLEAWK